jgi:UPF0716 protein FxsA
MPMNVAKWLLLGVLALPLMELAVFIAVAVAIGFGWALLLVLGGSLAGLLLLRHASGEHIARVRVAVGERRFTSLQADNEGMHILLAGILLLIPGFITDVAGLLLLIGPLRRGLAAAFGFGAPARSDGVVDLKPEQWRRVGDPALSDRREDDHKG